MTPKQFTAAVAKTRMRSPETIAGCRLVLVDGRTIYAAAKAVGRTQPVIRRAIESLTPKIVCQHCGQPIKSAPEGASTKAKAAAGLACCP